jgi:MFS family permease
VSRSVLVGAPRLALLVAGALFMAISAHVLMLAVLIPISGWLADRFGARRVFMTAVPASCMISRMCAGAV